MAKNPSDEKVVTVSGIIISCAGCARSCRYEFRILDEKDISAFSCPFGLPTKKIIFGMFAIAIEQDKNAIIQPPAPKLIGG